LKRYVLRRHASADLREISAYSAREYGVGSHIVFYCRAPDRIEIVRILHQRMDAGRHLS
jgi:plasmid stabilization system protein ParE